MKNNNVSANFYKGVGSGIEPLLWIKYDGSPWWPGISSLNDWKPGEHFFNSKTEEEYMDRYIKLSKNYVDCEDYHALFDIDLAGFEVEAFNYTFVNDGVYTSINGYPWISAELFLILEDDPIISDGMYDFLKKTFGEDMIEKDIRKVKWFF